jgi:hypothetical protein
LAEREAALWFAFRGDRMLVLEDAPVRVPPAGSPDEISIVRAMIDDFTIRHGLDPEDPETPG